MFANFLIGLREGLEASLVVGILVAYLVQTGRRDKLAPIWVGVGLAIALSLAAAASLEIVFQHVNSFKAQETLGGVLSIVTVGFVTWMVFWMRRAARHMRAELQGQVDRALSMGTTAVMLTAFIAVAREGLETALFLWRNTKAVGSTTDPILGAVLGLATAVVLGWLLYRRTVALNLATFFRWTGAGLIVVAAGVLAYGVHDLQEAAIIPGLNSVVFNIEQQLPLSSTVGTLFKGIFNYNPKPSWLELLAWLGYLIPTMVLFFRPTRAVVPVPPSPQEVTIP